MKSQFASSVVRKFMMAISGLLLIGFLHSHLWGNIKLYLKDPTPFNMYVFNLHAWGWILIVTELALAAFFLFHIVLGIMLTVKNRNAKGQKPSLMISKGGGTPSNVSSRNMAVTGVILMIFLFIHVGYFRFGIGVESDPMTVIDGQQTRDLYKLVMTTFQNPLTVSFYVTIMIVLAMHLRHAFWSAFQSLGLAFPRYSPILKGIGLAITLLLAVGFLFIPLAIYFGFQI